MFTRLLLPTITTVLLAPGMLFAADSLATAKPATAEVINTTCPMTGKPIDANAGTVPITVGEGASAKQYRMAFCSAECCAAFIANPEPVLRGKFAPGPKTNFK